MSGLFPSDDPAGQTKQGTNDISRCNDDASTAQMASRPSVGKRLQAGRLRCGLSVDDVARALKLSTRQVESIEDDDWANLPGKTIIRGFVRNYARLVSLDGHVLMSELDGQSMPKSPELRGAVGTPVSIPQEGKTDRRDAFRVLAGLLVLALALLVYFFFPPELWQSTVQAFKVATQSNQTVDSTSSEPSSVSNDQSETTVEAESVQPELLQPPVEVPPEPVPVAPNPEPQAVMANVLKFSFAQPSWVEVRDRNGQILLSQKNPAGSQREVEGEPPFSVVIGNALHVTLLYKGTAVDLSKRSKDDVARLTVE